MKCDKQITGDDIRGRIAELQEDGSAEALREEQHLQDVLDEVHWHANPVFIRSDYFFDGFAKDYAEELGPVTGWPYDYINWRQAAAALVLDYKHVDICGDTYYVRS